MLTFFDQGDTIPRMRHSVFSLFLALLQRTKQLVICGINPEYRYYRHYDGARSSIPLHLSSRAQEAESESRMIEEQAVSL